ncbi:glyoxal reductase-like isoform X2 [Asterias rubens]|uniref:glyoxal reductase-like isoform X2 n=1 Tax=Asterias rubens TaxID=7604 RepID=UPI001455B6E5|nr:glyoxal reductase-like isoform X2 [Asterias rubens]
MEVSECLTLCNGVKIPSLGIGTSPFGGYSHEAMVHALKHCKVRHIDTARRYNNEHLVAKSIQESGVVRGDLFITSKAWPSDYGYESTKQAFRESLQQTQVDYFDLYLLHWPMSPDGTNTKKLISESWRVLEELYAKGLCKSIGVSNFKISDLENLKETWTVIPQVNQIEVHVFNYPKELIDYCNGLGIQIVAYSPMGKGKVLDYHVIIKMAGKYCRTCSQVANRWVLQHGLATIPKSTKCSRVEENCKVFDFTLSDEDMDTLDQLHITDYYRAVDPSTVRFDRL